MNNYLSHYGIFGQKHGQRRYQYADGTYTEEGKARRRVGDIKEKTNKLFTPSIKSGKDKEPISPAQKILRETGNTINNLNELNSYRKDPAVKNRASQMSDAELRQAINRLQMERQYNDLTNVEINRGKAKTEEILGIAGSIVGIASGVVGIAAAVYGMKNK